MNKKSMQQLVFSSFQYGKIALSILLTASLLTLSGCRSKGVAAPTGSGATPAQAQQTTLQFWNLYDTEDTFRGQIQQYQSKHPEVRITYKKFTNIDEYENLLVEEIAKGKGPDLFAIHNSWVPKYQEMLAPYPVGKTTTPMTAEIFKSTFFTVAADDLIRDGKIFGIPLFIDSLAIFYNTALFRDGIANTDQPAETWDTIKEQVFALSKPNKSIERFAVAGMSMGRSDNISRAIDILYMLMLEHGTSLYDQTGKRAIFGMQQGTLEGTGQPAFPAKSALELFTSFARTSFKNYSWNDTITSMDPSLQEMGPFMLGKVGMMFGYSYYYDQLLAVGTGLAKSGETVLKKEEIGVAPAPQIVAFATSGKRDAFASYFPIVVSRNSANSDYAWDFLQTLASKESLQDYHDRTHKPTSRRDMAEEQMVEPIFGVFARQASYAKSYSIFNAKSYGAILSDAIMSVATGRSDEQSALTLAQKRVQCVMEKEQEQKNLDIDCTTIQ